MSKKENIKIYDSCESCGSSDLQTITRTYQNFSGLIDVGWKCNVCGYEFGFDLS